MHARGLHSKHQTWGGWALVAPSAGACNHALKAVTSPDAHRVASSMHADTMPVQAPPPLNPNPLNPIGSIQVPCYAVTLTKSLLPGLIPSAWHKGDQHFCRAQPQDQIHLDKGVPTASTQVLETCIFFGNF